MCFTQGRVFVRTLCYVEEALSTLYASSCDRPVLGTKSAPMEQELQQACEPPSTCCENSLPPGPAPALSQAAQSMELQQQAETDQPPLNSSSAGHLPNSELQQQQAGQSPYACYGNYCPPLLFPTPLFSLPEMQQALLQRSGKGWACCGSYSPPLVSAPPRHASSRPAPLVPAPPSLSLADLELELQQRSGKVWAHHLRTMWEADCSCRAAGYPESNVEELKATWGDGSACSGLPAPTDVPPMSQAAARESAVEVLQYIRQLAAVVWPDHPAAAAAAAGADSDRSDPSAYADWEVLQAELLLSPPPPSLEAAPNSASCSSDGGSWGQALWCFNPSCTNLSGPSELALKTSPCSGGCGVRYCSRECQAQGWRDGHRLSCGLLRGCKGAAAVVAPEVSGWRYGMV